ncbi:MAG: cyclic nucleotide-binding domain-containing protein [Thermomicrobiales bacterium]
MKIREVAAGTTIFLEGEANGEGPLYFVLEGTLRIYTSSLAGREQTMCLFIQATRSEKSACSMVARIR